MTTNIVGAAIAVLADGFNGLTGTRHAKLAVTGTNLLATVDTVGSVAVIDATFAPAGQAAIIGGTANTSATGLHIDNLSAVG